MAWNLRNIVEDEYCASWLRASRRRLRILEVFVIEEKLVDENEILLRGAENGCEIIRGVRGGVCDTGYLPGRDLFS